MKAPPLLAIAISSNARFCMRMCACTCTVDSCFVFYRLWYFCIRTELPEAEKATLHDSLKDSRDFISVEVFDSACRHSLDCLLQPWSLYLKHDVKLFME